MRNHPVQQQGSNTLSVTFKSTSSQKSSVICFGVKTIHKVCQSHPE